MIPYHQFGPWHLGPFTVYPFGILVGMAILVGTWIAQNRAEQLGLNPKAFSELIIWLFIGGFTMAHVVSVVFYFPDRIKENPLELLMFWRGISSFGGFFGGVLAIWIYTKKYKMPIWTTMDALAWGLSVAWIFGRMGCTVAFDHPGKPTHFFLAFKNPPYPVPEGYDAIHNLGFYEMLYTVFLAGTLYAVNKWVVDRGKGFAGLTLGLLATLYAPVRFGLDFLRIADKHYLGLTPGQYFAFVVLALGLWILWYRRRAPDETFPPYNYKTGKGGLLTEQAPQRKSATASNKSSVTKSSKKVAKH